MTFFMAASFAALLLQVNAGAAPLNSGMPVIDACAFAKSMDMSVNSNLCHKEAVNVHGYKSSARVMLVGEEKRSRERMRKSPSVDMTAPAGSMFSDEGMIKAKALGRNLLTFYSVAAPIPVALIGSSFLSATAPAWVPAAALTVGVILTADGATRAFTGKGVVERLYDRYTR